MDFLIALSIGFPIGLVAGLIVYCVLSYFESDEESSLNIVEDELQRREPTIIPSNGVTVNFNGKTKTFEDQSLKKSELVLNSGQWLEGKVRKIPIVGRQEKHQT